MMLYYGAIILILIILIYFYFRKSEFDIRMGKLYDRIIIAKVALCSLDRELHAQKQLLDKYRSGVEKSKPLSEKMFLAAASVSIDDQIGAVSNLHALMYAYEKAMTAMGASSLDAAIEIGAQVELTYDMIDKLQEMACEQDKILRKINEKVCVRYWPNEYMY